MKLILNCIALFLLSILYVFCYQQEFLTQQEAFNCFFMSIILTLVNLIGAILFQSILNAKKLQHQIGFSMAFTLIFLLTFSIIYMNGSQVGFAFPLLLLFNFVAFKAVLVHSLVHKK